MDVVWKDIDPVLVKIRTEATRSRPEERGRLLKPLAAFHASTGRRASKADVDVFVDLAIELAAHASLFERMAFSNALADIGHIPPRLLDALLRDVYLVSRPLIERARMSDTDLISVIEANASESTLLLIAQRAGTGVTVTDRLVASGVLKVFLALAGNDGAKLSMATFDRFSDMTTAQNDMDLALARRSDLPVSIAKALYQRISERSQKRVEEMMVRDRNRGRSAFVLGRT